MKTIFAIVTMAVLCGCMKHHNIVVPAIDSTGHAYTITLDCRPEGFTGQHCEGKIQ